MSRTMLLCLNWFGFWIRRFDFNDAVCVVTGGSSGIGRCLAIELAHRGANVIVVARRKERLAKLENQFDRIHAVVGDITNEDDWTRIRDAAASLSDSGEIDLLVNNAGCGGIGPFMESDPARLDQIMNVNFLAPIKLTRFLHPQLCNSNRPVVCNIGSVLGDVGVPNKAEYCAAKAAMAKWSQSLRAELWKSGIAVVLVSPSTTKSEFFDSLVGTPEGTTSSSIAAFQQTPQTVARVTAMAIRLRVAHVQPSAGGYLLSLGQRLFPWMMNWVLRQR